jgi:DNA segregation ATPase FtsK/SpoIIIE, S-DNA-T family
MKILEISRKVSSFIVKRFIEAFGLSISFISIFLLLSLLTYSPEDPNFIFPQNTEINNILGYRGSYISDLFFQSIGLISILLSLSFFITGLNIIKNKKITIIFQNTFFIILYSILGSLFFTSFYPESFWLSINGNGGFLGKHLGETFLFNLINLNKNISYYFLIFIIILVFFLSINFKLFWFLSIIKKLILNITNNKNVKEDLIVKENTIIVSDNNKLIQENLPFNKIDSTVSSRRINFKLPSTDFLKSPTKQDRQNTSPDENIKPEFLEKILLDFNVQGKIVKISKGPVVTLNQFEPAAGVKVSKIINLSEDIARNTSSESARISTIPGKSTVGIEIPNSSRENVYLSEIISNNNFIKKDIRLPIALGKDISGLPVIGDLASMPHLLIAGTTGSGKSVCINTIILSLLYKHSPDKCKFILIDPKMLELSTYEGIPHLLCPVITEAKKAASVLGWVVKEMESRYRLMTKEGVRNIDGYNAKHKQPMPYIVVIVDEMSDLMLVAGKEIENYIQKLSQMARAAGIHIIMATQRPSVDVITGTIKANFPTRISFQVTSKIDSRTILGEQGAEQLLGKGDMLYMSSANKIVRIHAPFVSENEIEKINDYLRKQEEPDYVDEILNFVDEKEINDNLSSNENKDELYDAALDIIRTEGKASTSFLQRKLQIGYNRAARIIDTMESNGIVSKANHVGKRDVLK